MSDAIAEIASHLENETVALFHKALGEAHTFIQNAPAALEKAATYADIAIQDANKLAAGAMPLLTVLNPEAAAAVQTTLGVLNVVDAGAKTVQHDAQSGNVLLSIPIDVWNLYQSTKAALHAKAASVSA